MTDPVTHWRAAAVAAACLLPFPGARAEPDSAASPAAQPTIGELLQRLDEQEQKIRVLERKLEIQDDTAKTVASTTPVVKADQRGFSIKSADGQNQIKLRGLVQTDGRFFTDDYAGDPPDTIFSLTDHPWGAWELVARYHVLNVDNAAFTGGADREDETVFLSRIQLGF